MGVRETQDRELKKILLWRGCRDGMRRGDGDGDGYRIRWCGMSLKGEWRDVPIMLS